MNDEQAVFRLQEATNTEIAKECEQWLKAPEFSVSNFELARALLRELARRIRVGGEAIEVQSIGSCRWGWHPWPAWSKPVEALHTRRVTLIATGRETSQSNEVLLQTRECPRCALFQRRVVKTK